VRAIVPSTSTRSFGGAVQPENIEWECEMAVVIDRMASYLPPTQAYDYRVPLRR